MPITEFASRNAATLGIRPQTLVRLEDLMQKYITDDRRQAIVIKATKDGHPIFEGTYGTNTKPYGVQPGTLFQVASITKPVVSALLLCLQEDGLVDLANPVYEYLPEYKGQGREKICLWHFLTHTSGIKDDEMWTAAKDYAETEYGLKSPPRDCSEEEDKAYYRQLCEKMGVDPDAKGNDRMNDPFYRIMLKLPLKHPPRSHMTYCNFGYQKLKEVIDAVTGEQIDAFAQRRLFHKLDMMDTHWVVPKDKWDRIIGRGDKCEGAPWINSERNYTNESGAGGLKTTVEDITRFTRMILSDGLHNGERILSRHSIREMTINHNAGVPAEGDVNFASWGLGWNLRGEKKDDSGILRSARCLDHGGWAGTKILLDPELNLTAAIFTVEYANDEENPVYGIYGPIMNMLCAAVE